MKSYPVFYLLTACFLLPATALALNIETNNGAIYRDCHDIVATPSGLCFAHSFGFGDLDFAVLPENLREQYGYDRLQAAVYSQPDTDELGHWKPRPEWEPLLYSRKAARLRRALYNEERMPGPSRLSPFLKDSGDEQHAGTRAAATDVPEALFSESAKSWNSGEQILLAIGGFLSVCALVSANRRWLFSIWPFRLLYKRRPVKRRKRKIRMRRSNSEAQPSFSTDDGGEEGYSGERRKVRRKRRSKAPERMDVDF